MVYIGKYHGKYNGQVISGFHIFKNKEEYMRFYGKLGFIASLVEMGCIFIVRPYDDMEIIYSKSKSFIEDFEFVLGEMKVNRDFLDALLGKDVNDFGFFPMEDIDDYIKDFEREERRERGEAPYISHFKINFFDCETNKQAIVGPFYAEIKGWSLIEVDSAAESYTDDLADSVFGKDKEKFYPELTAITEEEYVKNMNY